jgi:hypothetical protein
VEGGDAMEQEVNWTKIAVTFIRSLFGFLSGQRMRKSRRDNGGSTSESQFSLQAENPSEFYLRGVLSIREKIVISMK